MNNTPPSIPSPSPSFSPSFSPSPSRPASASNDRKGRIAAVVESHRAVARQKCLYLARLREFDLHRDYQQHLAGGRRATNTAQWLRLACGVERAQAEESLRVAYALLKMPAVESAFCRGEICYRKVRALAPVAEVATEQTLLAHARAMTDGELEEHCRQVAGGYTGHLPSPFEEAALASQDRMVVYHNPLCSKSRGALAILQARNVEFDTVEYLRTPLTEQRIGHILSLLAEPPAELVRKDANFRALGLIEADYVSADAVAKLLAEHPKLMQRPVVVRGERAVIARPSEKVEELL